MFFKFYRNRDLACILWSKYVGWKCCRSRYVFFVLFLYMGQLQLPLQLQWALYSASKGIKAKDIAFFDAIPEERSDSTQKTILWMEEHLVSTRIRGYDSGGNPAIWEVLFDGQPYVSYFLWDISVLDRKKLGIVGPRTPSPYGIDVMRDLSVFLSKYELATVSGGADGVDMMVHRYSLEMGIPTIVVLWAWIRWSLTYSSSKRLLYDVLEHWWLIYSSFKLDQCPTKFSFPQRNKYIAWMSTCLFVPEAGTDSGSLITVDFAAAMGTPCYSVPQSIYASCGAWVLKAWREGKLSLISSFEDVFDHFVSRDVCGWYWGYVSDKSAPISLACYHDVVPWSSLWPQDVVSQQIWSLLEPKEPLSADEIIKIVQREPLEVLWCLTMWEIEGFWKELSDWRYQRC